jgi:hypothetical protein
MSCKLSSLRTSTRFCSVVVSSIICLSSSGAVVVSVCSCGGFSWHAEVCAVVLLSDGIDQRMHSDPVSEKRTKERGMKKKKKQNKKQKEQKKSENKKNSEEQKKRITLWRYPRYKNSKKLWRDPR